MMTDELKRCPFCGSKAQIELITSATRIRCLLCGAQIQERYAADEVLIAAWNRRAAADGWIAVGERLPELNKDDVSAHVLVYTKRGQFSAYRTEGEWYVSLYDDEVAIEVTHWQPLPPPPGSNEPAPDDGEREEVELIQSLSAALRFARSVIKCGEPWDGECDRVISGAITDAYEHVRARQLQERE